jgi:hypothetical protein
VEIIDPALLSICPISPRAVGALLTDHITGGHFSQGKKIDFAC